MVGRTNAAKRKSDRETKGDQQVCSCCRPPDRHKSTRLVQHMDLALTKIIQHDMAILVVSQFQEKSGLNTASPFRKRHGYSCSPSYTTVLAIPRLIKPAY
jgi:hypothetical protein